MIEIVVNIVWQATGKGATSTECSGGNMVEGNPEPGARPVSKTISYSLIVDLSYPIHSDVPRWPGDPPVEFHTVADLETDGYFLRKFSLGEHSGTHINAPASFHAEGATIDIYTGASLVAPAVVMDLREKAGSNPDYTLGVADVLAWEQRHGPVPSGSVTLLLTGWQDKWSNPAGFLGTEFLGEAAEEGLGFPGFGLDAVSFLLAERGIAGVGIDTHGVDGGQGADFAVNRLVLEELRIVLENLNNLDQLPPTGATLVIGVLRLRGGSGSPVSVTAFVP